MRSYRLYGIKDGGAEEYIITIYSADEGKRIHSALKKEGHYTELLVRDCLGGLRNRFNLKKEAA